MPKEGQFSSTMSASAIVHECGTRPEAPVSPSPFVLTRAVVDARVILEGDDHRRFMA